MTELLGRPRDLYPRTYPKAEIVAYLDLLFPFFEHPDTPYACLAEAQRVANELQGYVPEARLIMGSGYPYYVLDIEDKRIPEYRRFFTEIKKHALKLGDYFACPDCIETRRPSSFRPFCDPCGSSLKAMDVVRALPDVDIIIVVDQPSKIQRKIQEFYDLYVVNWPDRDLRASLSLTSRFINSVLAGDPPDQREGSLHPDILLLATDEFVRAYEEIGKGNLKKARTNYSVLRGEWTVYPDDFAEDLFMSRHYPPLVLRDNELWEYAQEQTANFAKSGSLEEVYNRYMSFLELETDGKNYRIATSSPHLLNGVKARIAAYIEM